MEKEARPSARPLFAGLSILLSAGIWLLSFGVFSGTAQYIVMMIAAVTTLLYLSGASALTQDVVHPGLWAVSYAICVIVQNLLGSSTGPIVVGAISDKFGLSTAMLLVPIASLAAASCSCWRPRSTAATWRKWTRFPSVEDRNRASPGRVTDPTRAVFD